MDTFTPSPRYAFGASFIDPTSGLWFIADSPASNPEAWTAYLDGAEEAYRSYGVECVLDRPGLEDGGSVSLFWRAVTLEGELVAGVRCHGPIDDGAEVYAFKELAGHPRLDEFRWTVWARRQLGAIEAKGGWVSIHRTETRGISAALARCTVHSLDWFGARYAFGTSSTHSMKVWGSVGCRAMEGYEPLPYPDARYATVPVWWDRHRTATRANGKQSRLIATEAEQLLHSSLTIRSTVPDVIVEMPG
jgi:hypothetical protein